MNNFKEISDYESAFKLRMFLENDRSYILKANKEIIDLIIHKMAMGMNDYTKDITGDIEEFYTITHKFINKTKHMATRDSDYIHKLSLNLMTNDKIMDLINNTEYNRCGSFDYQDQYIGGYEGITALMEKSILDNELNLALQNEMKAIAEKEIKSWYEYYQKNMTAYRKIMITNNITEKTFDELMNHKNNTIKKTLDKPIENDFDEIIKDDESERINQTTAEDIDEDNLDFEM